MAAPLVSIPVRPLGSQGLKVSAQGLGCMGMSAFYGPTGTEDENIKVINRAKEIGVTFLDTSDIYGPFTNEELIGRAISGQREEYVIATKMGIVFRDGQMAFDGSRKHVREACEASLKRLGIDYIDLYYLHRVDPKTPVEETFAEMKALVEEGKVKYVGISEASAEDIRKAHAVCPLTAVQLEWSIFTRDVEEDIIPVCRELGIGIVAYSPLGRGMLTGALKPEDLSDNDFRKNNPRFVGANYQKNLELVREVEAIAKAKGVTAGQVALAWVQQQGEDVVPIPGTRRVSRLEENAAAFGVKLTDEEMQKLSTLEASGDRYDNMEVLTYHYGKK